MCLGICACQDKAYRHLTKIDRHKKRGWVGVTGGFAAEPRSSKPRLSKRRRSDAARKGEENQSGSPPVEEAHAGDGSPATPSPEPTATLSPALAARAPDQDAPPSRQGCSSDVTTPSGSTRATSPETPATAEAPTKNNKKKRLFQNDTPAAPAKDVPSDEDFVGRRVKCWWPAEGKWFMGTVVSYSARRRKYPHRVEYDDGDWEDLCLPDDTVQFV